MAGESGMISQKEVDIAKLESDISFEQRIIEQLECNVKSIRLEIKDLLMGKTKVKQPCDCGGLEVGAGEIVTFTDGTAYAGGGMGATLHSGDCGGSGGTGMVWAECGTTYGESPMQAACENTVFKQEYDCKFKDDKSSKSWSDIIPKKTIVATDEKNVIRPKVIFNEVFDLTDDVQSYEYTRSVDAETIATITFRNDPQLPTFNRGNSIRIYNTLLYIRNVRHRINEIIIDAGEKK